MGTLVSCVLGQLSREEAERIALAQTGPNESVLSATLAHADQFGGMLEARDLIPGQQVWVVTVTGDFPASCPSTNQGTINCPPDATSALVVIDAVSGAVLFMRVPAR